MSAHSPGDWTVKLEHKTDREIGRYLVRADILAGRQRIGAATIRPEIGDARVEANARVMAAGAEMLEALRKAVVLVRGIVPQTAEFRENQSAALPRWRALIAKAEGKAS